MGTSDQISRSVVSDSLQPHESQHARPPCPSLSPGVHSNSRPSSQLLRFLRILFCFAFVYNPEHIGLELSCVHLRLLSTVLNMIPSCGIWLENISYRSFYLKRHLFPEGHHQNSIILFPTIKPYVICICPSSGLAWRVSDISNSLLADIVYK